MSSLNEAINIKATMKALADQADIVKTELSIIRDYKMLLEINEDLIETCKHLYKENQDLRLAAIQADNKAFRFEQQLNARLGL